MRKLFLFMMVSVDGFFEGPNGDLSWHNVDEEFNEFAIDQLNHMDTLLFGRVTYEMMAGYWPTEGARKDDPEVAGRMNATAKLVFSKTLSKPQWENTKLIKNDFAAEVRKLKQEPGKDMIIFGSSELGVTFLREHLLDELRIMINPIILGSGHALFQGIDDKLKLNLLKTRAFRSGNVLLVYDVATK